MESVMKMFSLEGQTAVITGGTRGIGAAMAIALAEAGADIILIQVQCPTYSSRNANLLIADRYREMNQTPKPSTVSINLVGKPALYQLTCQTKALSQE